MDYSELFRDALLKGNGLYSPFSSVEELRKSRMYIETMEDFIDKSESEELAKLSSGIESLTPEERDEYWQFNYPIHWQEVFATRVRSGFLIQLCSFLEGELDDICHRIQMIARIQKNVSNMTGSTIEKASKYVAKYGDFSSSLRPHWETIERIYDIRNVFVHYRGFSALYRNHEKIVEFSKSVPGVKCLHSFIELERGFCEYCNEEVAKFQEHLRTAYDTFRKRLLAIEALKEKGA